MPEGDATRDSRPQPRIGSYQIVHSLGSGGMSSVFKAVHVETGHEVAVKVLPRALAKNVTLLQRFLREAKSAEALEHPNIVSIYDRGVDQGRHYLVLEYVAGGDLHDRVRNEGPLGIAEAVSVIRSVSKGLQFAASRGLIHRDIKPANLLLTPDGRVKIIDLGLALQAENEDERVTREGTTVGTVDYMSPEQARDSRATSERSDIYSLGCTFYFLLTGSPPFPGGDVADKLSRHCLEAPPDPRKLRPEISGPLSLLMRRMMAKRPENRFGSYEELIAELDAVPTGEEKPAAAPTPAATGEVPLYALFDDEDDAPPAPAPSPGPEPLYALIDDEDSKSEAPAAAAPEPLYALIDDEDSSADTAVPVKPAPRSPRKRELKTFGADEPVPTPSLRDVSMADLAALEGPPPTAAPARKSPVAPTGNGPAPGGERVQELFGGDDSVEGLEEAVTFGGSRTSNDATKRIVTTYSVIGIALVLLVIGTHQLIRSASAPSDSDLTGESGDAAPVTEAPVQPPTPPAPAVANRSPDPDKSVSPRPPVRKTVANAPSPPPPVWVEPSDPTAVVVPNAELDAALEGQFTPDWSTGEVTSRLVSPQFVTVQRAHDSRDKTQKSSLRQVETRGGTIELADNGPFFEDDLALSGLVMARPGYRPIVCIDGSGQNRPVGVDGQAQGKLAVFVLEGRNLTLDGIDLVVNVAELPPRETALFFCRGAGLTLRNCTITIVNPGGRPFAIVRSAESPKRDSSRIMLDRTMVRGKAFTGFDLGGGTSEVFLKSSVLVSGKGACVFCTPSEATALRKVQVIRSLIAGRGSLLEFGGSSLLAKAGRVTFSTLGSTFANLEGEGAASLVLMAEEGRPGELIDWKGDFNVFAGWRDRVSVASNRSVKVANLAASRSTWRGTDLRSRESRPRWKLTTDLERLTADELLSFSPEGRSTLTRVPTPNPHLLQQTVVRFGPQVLPQLAQPAPIPATAPVNASARWNGTEPASGVPAIRELRFDLTASPCYGDLGDFLEKNVRAGDRGVRVIVSGTGTHRSTPVRLPDGVSLQVQPESVASGEPNTITWTASKGAPGEALLEVHGGDLVLSNIKLMRDATTRPERLILVEGGHLVLDHCALGAPGRVDPGGGTLIEFRAPSTQPFNHGIGPFQAPMDRPTCFLQDSVLITGGDAIRTTIGRGTVVLSNCVVAAGGNVFVLEPARVARSRFDATLVLDHCTVAAEQSFVMLRKWPGSSPGPDRPWLVSTAGCAFFGEYERRSDPPESVLLRVEPDSLSHGALFWEGSNDAYEVRHFLAQVDWPLDPRKTDLQAQWERLWGARHMHNVTGPLLKRGVVTSTSSIRLKAPLRPGQVRPEDLEPDPKRVRSNVGADFARLPIEGRGGGRPR